MTSLRHPAVVVNAALVLALSVAVAGVARQAPDAAGRQGLALRAPAGALRIESSRHGRAVLRAPALAPGAAVRGAVTIANRGAAGRLLLAGEHLVEAPGLAGAALGRALRLRVTELGRGASHTFYSGPLTAMPRLHLGPLAAGASRRFRFIASLPAEPPGGEALMGARISFDYSWRLRPVR